MSPLDALLLTLPELDDGGPPGERWCPTGQHWLYEASFHLLPRGRLARDCKRCEAARAANLRRRSAQRLPMTGIDMDSVHWKLGKVNPMLVEFNPACKHDRTSYSIVHCSECLDYSQRLQRLRAGAATAQSVESGASTPTPKNDQDGVAK